MQSPGLGLPWLGSLSQGGKGTAVWDPERARIVHLAHENLDLGCAPALVRCLQAWNRQLSDLCACSERAACVDKAAGLTPASEGACLNQAADLMTQFRQSMRGEQPSGDMDPAPLDSCMVRPLATLLLLSSSLHVSR